MQRRIYILVMAAVLLLWNRASYGEEPILKAPKVAQLDVEDSYDPFSDYSEFDEAQEEEEDINFFRHGRFVTIGLLLGYRGWTEVLSNLYSANLNYGIFLSYFFDLRFALQFAYITGDHSFGFTTANTSYTGTISIQDMAVDLKYYINTQNVTKGLAKFNPYVLVGFSEIFRTTNVPSTSAFGKDNANAFDLGGGIEFPLMRNKMFFGAQAVYQLINFPDENTPLEVSSKQPTGIYPHGDSYLITGVLGINF